MAQHEVHHHLGEHEYSYWPLPVGLGVLLVPLTFIAFFVWQKPMLALIFGGVSLVLFVLGIAGWVHEFFSKGHEEGLGMPAMMFFIVSEVVIFGTMFAGFYMARATHADVWAQWVPKGMNLTIPVILTFILWASSATIAIAEKFFEKGKNGLSALFVFFTIILGSAFMVIHIMEWLHLWHEGFTLSSNMYGTGFYMLTGIHTSHIVVGLLTMLVGMFLLLTGKAGEHKGHTYIKAITMYWHFVDIMWLLVASSAYLIGSLSMRLFLFTMIVLSTLFAREPYEYGRYTSYYGEQDVSVVKIQEDLFIGKEVADVRVKTLSGEVRLKEFIKGKPTALLFAYYTCDTVCPITAENLYKLSKNLSKDYRYVVLSFDERDNLSTMKEFMQKNFGTTEMPDNWLVGILSKEDIRKITQSVGYKFYYIDRDRIFIHPSVTIFLSPDGKVMRYLYGAFLRDKDVSLAFVDAQREKPSVNNIVDLAILACYRYDHARARYVIDPTLIFAGIGILGVIGTFTLAYFYSRNRKEVHP